MDDQPLRVGQLMHSASRKNAGVFEAAKGMSLALSQQPDLHLEVFAIKDQHTEADLAHWEGIPIHAFPMVPPAVFSCAPMLDKGVSAYQPHIVHLHGLWTYPSLVARRLARRSSAGVVISVHGMLSPWALHNGALKKKVALWLYERGNLASADCIHATNESEYQQIRALGLRQPVAVIPLGVAVNSARETKPFRRGVRTLLSLGRLHPIKGLDRLLRAWSNVSYRYVDWHLKIGGPSEGDYRRYLTILCDSLGCARVDFVDALYGEQKTLAYLSADLFVLPSLSENFALTVPEALGHAVPVIASTATPWSGVVPHRCGWWVEPEVDALASALDEAMRLPQKSLREMGERGRAWMEREFTWGIVAERMRAVYDWLAGRGPQPGCVIQ